MICAFCVQYFLKTQFNDMNTKNLDLGEGFPITLRPSNVISDHNIDAYFN